MVSSRMAAALGLEHEAKHYLDYSLQLPQPAQSANFFFHPKDKEGKFIEPFDYRFSGGMGARDYYGENNALGISLGRAAQMSAIWWS